jgi:hypothetical protein
MAKLRIGHADGRTEERDLGPGSYRVGRERADLVLPHRSVSAHHAQLEIQPGGVTVFDVGSRNGTLDPNGQRLTAAYVLLPEQPIRLGACTLTLLRSPGGAGGTLVMQGLPALRARPVAAQHDPGALPRSAWWLKVLGIGAVLLLGLVSLQTCGALVKVLGAR